MMDKPSFRAKLGGKPYSLVSAASTARMDRWLSTPTRARDQGHRLGSYYPGLIVKERIAPGHLDADIFCDVFSRPDAVGAWQPKERKVAEGGRRRG